MIIGIQIFVIFLLLFKFRRDNHYILYSPRLIFISLSIFYLFVGQFIKIKYDEFDTNQDFIASLGILLVFFIFYLFNFFFRSNINFKNLKFSLKIPKHFRILFSFYFIFFNLFIGYLFFIHNYIRVIEYINFIPPFHFSISLSRAEFKNIFTDLPHNLPYIYFFQITLILLCISIKNKFITNKSFYFVLFLFMPFIYLMLLEGERSNIIKLLIIFITIHSFSSYERVIKYKKQIILTIVLICLFFSFLGFVRSINFSHELSNSNNDQFISKVKRTKFKNFLPVEFSSVYFTYKYSINSIDNENFKPDMNSYKNSIYYIFPRSLYSFVGSTKPLTISDQFSNFFSENFNSNKNNNSFKKISFGMSPLSEAIFNYGYFGIIIFCILFYLLIIFHELILLSTRKSFLSIIMYTILLSNIFIFFRSSFASYFVANFYLIFYVLFLYIFCILRK